MHPRTFWILPLLVSSLASAQQRLPAPGAPAKASPWSCYAGGNLGYGSGKQDMGKIVIGTDDDEEHVVVGKSGGLIGAEAGCDYTGLELPGAGSVVMGPVLDVSFGGISGTKKFDYENFFGNEYTDEFTGSSSRLISLRGRVGGIPAWNKNLFLYATLGYAWMSTEIAWEMEWEDDEIREEETAAGWIFGGGVEFEPEFVRNLKGKLAVEYLRGSLKVDDKDYDKWEESLNLFRVTFRRYF